MKIAALMRSAIVFVVISGVIWAQGPALTIEAAPPVLPMMGAAARVRLDGAAGVGSSGTGTVLTSARLEDENSLEQPKKVAPVTNVVNGLGQQFNYTFAPQSLTVLRLRGR